MTYSKTVLFTILISGCFTYPVDEPIHIDLPVYSPPQYSQANDDMPRASSDHQPLAYDFSILPENHPGGEVDQSAGGNFITYKHQSASNILGNTLDSKASFIGGGPFLNPVTKIESAVQETEGFGSKALSIKENIQSIVAGLFQPKPIVDMINESDKYGNTGDKFYSAGRAVVEGASGVSNLVNSVLEVPGKIFGKITRAATEKLNNLGGKLIGL